MWCLAEARHAYRGTKGAASSVPHITQASAAAVSLGMKVVVVVVSWTMGLVRM